MKLSKLNRKKSNKISKGSAVSKNGAKVMSSKHNFRAIPADYINSNRSSAYNYLTF